MTPAPSPPGAAPPPSWTEHASLLSEGPDATATLAARLAPRLRPGDTVLLQGDLGSGKTHLARALIRAALGDPQAEVPSPSFTLVQSYDTEQGEIWHADLYRLEGAAEIDELGFDDAFETAICLVEWPERFGASWPVGAVCVTLSTPPGAPETRHLRLSALPDTALAARLAPVFAP